MRLRHLGALATIAALLGAPPAFGTETALTASPPSPPTVETRDSRGEGAASSADSDPVAIVLFIGFSGVATVALVSAALFLAAGRRRRDEEPAATAAEAIRVRRIQRRARMRRQAEDPIIASLGLDEEPARRAGRRAGPVDRGPGERTKLERD